MDIQELRRDILRHYIKTRFDGNTRRFAISIEKSDGQLNDMLAGRKPFGEKVARNIEQRANLKHGYLDSASSLPDEGGSRLQAEEPASSPYIQNAEGKAIADFYLTLPPASRGEFRAALVKAYFELCMKHPELDIGEIGKIIDLGRN